MSAQASRRGILLAICYLGFISLGLPDTLIGIAWPSVRQTFGLRYSDVSWIFFGSGCSYMLSSFFAGRLLKKMNVGMLLAASSALVALSGIDFCLARVWALFAAGSLLHGLGSGAIDAGLNHFVAHHFSARHMTWLHACYSLGAMLGPLVMTAMIAWTNSWRLGYMTVAATLLVLALLFAITRKLWDEPESSIAASGDSSSSTHPSTLQALRHPIVRLHILLFFIYAGIESSLGQWSFTVLTESRHVDLPRAGIWVSIYWASILAGRILFGFVVDRFGIDTLIRLSTVAAMAGTALFAWSPWPALDPVALAVAGLGLAAIFPCLMTRTPQRLGKDLAAHAIGFQVGAAMLGVAALPSSAGWIAQNAGLPYVAPAIFLMTAALFVSHEIVISRSTRS